jgi:hypothetical protein
LAEAVKATIRTDEQYLADRKARDLSDKEEKQLENERARKNLDDQNARREKELFEYMNDACDMQVERQFTRQREVNHQFNETIR